VRVVRLDGLPLETMGSCRWVLVVTRRKRESGQSAGAVLLGGAEKLAWLLTSWFGYRHGLGTESTFGEGARLAHAGKFEVRVLFGVGENGQLKNPKIRKRER
jgi:hypothetical protein